ncbi:exosortase A [Thiobacter aerophilum]|uniref:Exosortase A n=1 Tax=Thiobacter aerophilum TaxID=3121275 RepID=A0ABV0EGU2_9BURK
MNVPSNRPWPRAAWLTLAGVVVLFFIYWSTVASTVAIWRRSETFAHGFLIFPISAWLIWQRRREIAALTPVPDWRGLILLAVLGLAWLAAEVARVLVIQQLALVAMVPALVFTLLGWRITWAMAFPLAFLLLAVPMGEFLIPPMMEFTADFTVAALRLTGIPVYREGTFFTIPSGNWSVVEGCSGLRYLIASFTLGTLYGYLTYRSLKKRLLFALASIVVPIIANGLRAYMIVMIAHLSDMRLALGVDHYIYGWVFFGVVMLLLFWIGSFWREDERVKPAPPVVEYGWGLPGGLKPMLAASLIIAGFWPAYAAYVEGLAPNNLAVRLQAPAGRNGWRLVAPVTDWRPEYKGMDASLHQTYGKDGRVVGVFLAYYRYQRQDAELINSQNVMVRQKHPVWSNVGEAAQVVELAGRPVTVIETRLRSPHQRLLVWHWNWLNGPFTVNPYWAKFYEARARLLGHWDDAAAIIVYTPYEERPENAARTLQDFLRDMLPALTAKLEQAAET